MKLIIIKFDNYSIIFIKALIILMPFFLLSQVPIISGKVVDSTNIAIPFSIVTATTIDNDEDIIAYSNSTSNGEFRLKIPLSYKNDSLFITVRQMSYEKKRLRISNKSQSLTIKLFKKKNQLDEILLKAQKTVEVKGDTITYNVAGLKKEKDYTIEEVIDRIPGVKIAENGQISYKDKPISHLYINGVDLLEGRYNIATRGIPADAVKDIEVLQRHNHARVDIGRTESDAVAFNLKIKKNRSLVFGSAKGDAGVPLLTVRASITPIYLKEKVQNIASLRANNFGKSLRDYGSSLVAGNRFISSLKLNEKAVLNAPNTNGNTISDKYWLDNESYAITNDALFNASDSLLLKASVNYTLDDTALEEQFNSVFYFDNDSTLINRNSQNRLREEIYRAGLIQEVNKRNFYLKNKLSITGKDINGGMRLIQNDNNINTSYQRSNRVLSNISSIKNIIDKKVIDSGLLLELHDSDEQLLVAPAVFNEQIDGSFNGEQTRQNIHTSRFNIGGFTSFDFDTGKLNWDFTQNISFKRQQLTSDLAILSDTQQSDASFPFLGDISIGRLETTTKLSTSYRWKRFKTTFTPAVNYINLSSDENRSQTATNENLFLFTPSASINYNYNNIWNFGLSGNRSVSTSQFDQLYNGVIMRNFSGLSRNAPVVNINRNNNLNLFWGYNDILKGFFFKNSTRYNRSLSDITFSSELDNDGLVNLIALERPNTAITWSNSSSLTKRFFSILKTELSYGYTYRLTEQFFNNVLQENINNQHNIQLELNLDDNSWYGLNYKGLTNFASSQVNGFKTSNRFIKHDITVDFYTSSKTRLNIGMESAISTFSNNTNRNQNTLFNTSFYYKPSKKLFLRASLLNIFNEDFFTISNSSSNFVSQSRFSLRPRQFTIGFNYTL